MDDASHPIGTGAPRPHRHVHLSAEQVVVLAHPLRSRLLSALRVSGPATSTALALALGTNSGTSSYHLRKLAGVGLVVEAPELGDGRDRWWRAAADEHSYSTQDFDGDADNAAHADAAAAADWLHAHYLRTHTRRAEDWVESRRDWPAAWQGASTMSDYLLHLTPEQLRALNAELGEVLARWREAGDPTAPGAEQVVVLLHDFPLRTDPPASPDLPVDPDPS